LQNQINIVSSIAFQLPIKMGRKIFVINKKIQN